MPRGDARKSTGERFSHATWAGLVALVLSLSTLLWPLDELTWAFQSRFANLEVSDDIAYVGSTEDVTDPAHPERRVNLARTLDTLRQSGVDRVYLDMDFDRPATPEADARLNAALRAFAGRAFLVRSVSNGLNGDLVATNSSSPVGHDVPAVGTWRWRNFMGYSWDLREVVQVGDQQLPAFHVSLARRGTGRERDRINYSFARESIPAYRLADLAQAIGPLGSANRLTSQLAGKSVVIGNLENDAQTYSIPGHRDVPSATIDIYAAETLKAGVTRTIDGSAMIVVLLIGLLLVTRLRPVRARHIGYAVIGLALPLTIFIAGSSAVPVSPAGAIVLLLVYAGLRLRARWKAELQLVDPETRLPTFAAMEADADIAEGAQTIVVARIHRFEEVKRTLPRELHAEYMLRLIARLRAAKPDAVIYTGPGHLIAWTFPEKEPALVREHLEGLRALFAAPLLVGDHQVDVRVTFGVDITPSPNVARRLSAAVDAAERTTETYEPIVIAETASDEDLIWNISLQARIDAALASGEIYMIYQPKVLLQTGEIVGVEALVRWRDPVKGLIPPDHFIRQCENAGRMSHLTRHALTQSCQAGMGFAAHGMPIPVAVNISSTLVHEPQIVAMVSEVLRETGFPAQRLTLEITETYRISNFERAAEVLGDLASLGAKISMDDFGVGAASLEALQRLPFSELKIDRLFIAAMCDQPKAAAIVRNVLNMGEDMRITVVAEGVETAATLASLRDAGCKIAQGFGISRPIAYEEILQFQQIALDERLKKIV